MILALWGSGPSQLSSLCQSLVLFGFSIMYIRRLPSRDGCLSFNLVYSPDYYHLSPSHSEKSHSSLLATAIIFVTVIG